MRGVAPASADETTGLGGPAAALRAHLTNPLHRNAYTLMLNQALSAALGVVYWIVVARLYDADVVGRNAALIATLMFLSMVAQIGMKDALTQFVGRAGDRAGTLVFRAYAAVVGLSVLAGVLWVAVAGAIGSGGGIDGAALAAWLVVSVATNAVFYVQDGILSGTRRTGIVFLENGLYNLSKIALLVGLAHVSPKHGILLSWTIPIPFFVLGVTWMLVRRVIPKQPATGIPLPSAGAIGRWVAGDHLGSLFAESAARLLPLMVIHRLGAESNAYFYQAWVIASMLPLITGSAVTSFVVEAAERPSDVRQLARRTLTHVARIGLPAAAFGLVAAPVLLRIFGADYADNAVGALRWLLLATVPGVVTIWFLGYARVTNRISRVVAMQAVVASVTLAVSWALLPGHGIAACGIGWLAGQSCAALLALAWGLPALRRNERPDVMHTAAQQAATVGASGYSAPTSPWPAPVPARDADPAASPLTARSATSERRRGIDPARAWGLLPEVSVVVGLGVVGVAYADRLSRTAAAHATPLFWLGILAIVTPVALRIAFGRISRTEAIGLVLVLGTGFYLTKLASSPDLFRSFDELIHYRTAADVMRTDHLYSENSMLPVSPLFPGLEVVTSAIANMTGLSITTSGLVLIWVARCVLMLALFLLMHELLRSVRLAATATVLYAGCSTFFGFDIQFAYESLALPFAFALLYVVARLTRSRRAQPTPRRVTAIAALMVMAIVLTHHLTTYATAGLLLAWTVVHLLLAERTHRERNPLLVAVPMLVLAGVWALAVATDIFSYLGGPVGSAVQGIRDIFEGAPGPRRPFEAASGSQANRAEQGVGGIGTLVTVALILIGLVTMRTTAPRRALTPILALMALLYPASLGLRFAQGAWEASNRASSFLFVGVAFVASIALWWWRRTGATTAPRRAIAATVMVLIPVTGITVGSGSERMPRPYQVASGELSIDPHQLETARWVKRELGPDNRIAGDRTTSSVMNAYGLQHVISSLNDDVIVTPLFLSPVVGNYERSLIRDGSIAYLAVDRRIEGATTPRDGEFYEEWEQSLYPGAYSTTKPVEAARLEKWNGVDGVDRVYDDGSLVLYDVRAVRDAP